MSNQIIGNTEYKSIKEKAYINGTQENIMQLAAELDKAGIDYSGRVSDYRSAITVEAADRARTLEIMKDILNATKETAPAANAEKNIIGNVEYRYIPNKRYVRGDTEVMLRTADRLTAENISFSGRIKGDTVTLTVSGDEAQELVKKYFAEEKNRIENIQSAYFLALASDTFEDGYYISEVNVNTGEEIAQHRSQFGDISMFISVDSAVRYAEGAGVTLSNTDEQLNEWRRIEIEAEAEKDRQLNLSRSREIIKRLPMTSENDYEEQFVLHENAVDWIYFNPDGANGEGQFVVTTLYADDILNAYIARAATDEHNSQSAFIEIIENGKQTIINADTEDFERYALSFINSRNKDNVIVSAPVVSGNGYDKDFQKIINTLESIFDEVSSYKENHITDISDHITVEGHMGMWYVIDSEEIEGKKLFLLEHEEYGDETANIIVDENKNLVMEGVYNGFDDYLDSLEYDDDKQFVSRDFAVELWENGFTVFMNDRNNALSNNSYDSNMFDLFTEENNNTFYAFSKDIVQQRFLDDTVTLLDELNYASMREASHTEFAIDTISDYAKDMYEDGECAYKWRDGLTEWQHISASIRSGNTEYIYAWLNDLPFELTYLEENQNVSIKTALDHLDNYEKQYMGKLSIDELKKGTRLVYNNINWEVTHVNNNVLALKNLNSDNEMSSTIIEHWQNVVTRSKVEFIAEKENSPMGNYVPDENLPLSKQLYDLAKIELTNYENSLDTAEKAKAAAYELSVKRDILSYIEHDLPSDITDSDVENACRRLISTGYPLDTFYQDWLKNEYDNRMEAIRMTAEDTFRKENVKEYDIDNELRIGKNPIVFSVVSINGGDDIVVGEYIDGDNVRYMEEYLTAVSETSSDTLDVQVHFYTVGDIDNDNESIEADEAQVEYISVHLNEVLSQATLLDSERYSVKITYKEIENSDRIIPEKNLEFTVITFEDDSVYVEAGRIDDDNVSGTAAYADMMKNNFDIDKMEDLDESIKVEYAVYHMGDGEAVMPTEEKLAEIRNSLDDYIKDKKPVSTEKSALFPWVNDNDILYDLDKYWQEKSDFSNIFEYEMDKLLYIVPTENLSPIAVTADGVRHYDTISSVTQIKLKGSDWLGTIDAAVEMNRRGINFDDVELLRITLAFPDGNYLQKDITPEQFAAYSKKIDDDPQKYEDIIFNYKKFKSEKENDFAQAQEDLQNNLAKVLYHSVASDELENISKVIFTDDTDKKTEIAKQYLDSNFTYGKYTDIIIEKSDDNVRLCLANGFEKSGFEITYPWSDIAAAYEQAALNDMEWYYTSGRVLEVYNQTLEKDTAVGGGLDVQLDRAVFTDWVSDIITRQNGVKTAYESNDKALFESTVRREVDNYFYMLCDKDESINGYNLKDISDFVNNFCTNGDLRKEIYTTVSENVDISLGVIEKARETAHNAGVPFRETFAEPEEEFNPYAFDGTMSSEDYELMHKLMREDSFEIYQVKSGEEYRDKRFTELSALGSAPNIADYDLVYSGKLSEQDITGQHRDEILESLFAKFNNDRPEDFKGHSLSVSDIVVLHKWGENTAHYVDSMGFKHIPTLERAMRLINNFCEKEYGSTGNFSDLHNVSLAHTTVTDDELPVQVTADLVDFKIVFELNGEKFNEEQYKSLEELIEYELSNLDFNELVYVPDDVVDRSKGVDKSDSPVGTNEALEKAKQLISDFCEREYGSTGDFSDLHNVSIAYTTLTDDELPIQVTADLIDFRIIYEFDGKMFDEEKYDSLEEMNEKSLSCLDFDELVSIPFRKLDELTVLSDDVVDKSTGMDKSDSPLGTDAIPNKIVFEMFGSGSMYFRDEQMNDLAEISADGIKYYAELSENDKKKAVDKASELFNIEESRQLVSEETKSVEIQKEASLKTVANQYNSYLIVQDVVYALKDLLNGIAENYDWRNYAEAFNKVLDSNVNTNVALPLYKSGADDILLAAAEKKVISADDIAKALSNLELVLQNSHLLKNPEEKIEQMSFFSNTPNRTSSDEIGYSSAPEVTQNDKETSPVGNNPQEEKTEKKTAVDYTITDKNYGTEGGAKTRFANNVEAIKLLKSIEKENRTATPEEQEVLAKYVGWGGIANAFDSRKPDWNKEYKELKSLLTDEEYRAARASTMNAHYTSPVVINAIYSGLENLGFKGGKIIEPAMGIGNFFGAMPDSIHNNSELHGVELDSITGRIAQQLYPSANIQVKGYEDTGFENSSFDVAVGNVPFGGYKLNDKDYNKQNFFIHDYFFAKTLDKVRAGGIVAFVTSKGTLDKESPEVRKYLAERAELLGAIRLPNNTFKSNAGTEVTSDIIFLQKRERPISIEENPPEWIYKDMLPNGIAVNKYFADHPEMILGNMVEGNKLYGNQTDASMCVPIEGADLEEQLAAAIKNITGEYREAEKGIAENSPVGNTDEIPCPPNAPKFSFIVQDDILYYHKSSDTMEKYKAPDKSIDKIKAMVQLRDSVHKLLDLQLENTNGRFDTAISEAQAALNGQYDDFSEKYGLISNSENKMLFRSDNSYHLIKSLEKLDKDGNFIGKADIFSKITINPKVIVSHCDNAQDALILSLSEKMCVNLDYMSILTGKSEEELIAELGDKIYQNPQKFMRWESADEYLTGNIRSKLAAAEAAGLTRNAEALRAVMPERIEAADISVKLGSAWIDPDYIRQFIVETLKPDFVTSKNIEVTYMPATDRWKVDGYKSAYENTLANETYGTYDMNAYEIIEATLNMQKAEIKQRVKDEYGNDLRDSKGRYVYEVNQKKTMIAQSKQDELKRMFSDWIFSDPDRREKLVDVYNEKFNSVRLREYDGSHLNFVGMSSLITLKDHQKNAVARGLYSKGNTLLAHEVGAGKTYEMIAIAMEGKRLGLHNKSLITAPNGLTEQWGNAFRTLYPNANVLVATEKDFQKENRRDLFAKIATGDWDAVVIGHSQFDMIHLSRERELDVLHSELDILEEALREMDDGGKKNFSVKQIEKSIRMYEDKIEKLLAKAPEDDMLCFEKLGIDKIFVDESQAYKNLDTPTKMRNVSGIGSGGSGRSMQLLMKCKYLDEITGGKGVVFASGTPISNSMSEMYTLMRYLQADKLAELGINSFDRWASIFGETVSSMELSPEGNGKYQMKTRFAKFQNLPELMNIFKECADIKTAESLDLDRPDFEMHNVNVPATAIQAMMIKELGERAKEIRAGHVDPTDDNMCKLTVDGRKIGLDQRCMNPNLPDDPKSKVNVCINNVFDIWQRTAEEKSTQLIFCDLATPQPTLNENTYTVYRKNAKGGYSDVYSAKLGERDTAEKIMKKLNGKKPPKNYEAGDVSNGDIIMLKRVNYEEETAYNTAFEVVDGKLTEIAPETWEKLKHTPVEEFESERRFCVYDDIKQKLIEKGIPEKEIAFIHDVDKAEDKQRLYDKMNKGEIRVLIGSTFKCGAGMNAQERMIALHDLDAPMRPSDVEQTSRCIIKIA